MLLYNYNLERTSLYLFSLCLIPFLWQKRHQWVESAAFVCGLLGNWFVLLTDSPLDGGRDSTNVDLILWSLLMPTTLSDFCPIHPSQIQLWHYSAFRQRIILPREWPSVFLHTTIWLQTARQWRASDYVTGDYRLKQVFVKKNPLVFKYNVFAAHALFRCLNNLI